MTLELEYTEAYLYKFRVHHYPEATTLYPANIRTLFIFLLCSRGPITHSTHTAEVSRTFLSFPYATCNFKEQKHFMFRTTGQRSSLHKHFPRTLLRLRVETSSE